MPLVDSFVPTDRPRLVGGVNHNRPAQTLPHLQNNVSRYMAAHIRTRPDILALQHERRRATPVPQPSRAPTIPAATHRPATPVASPFTPQPVNKPKLRTRRLLDKLQLPFAMTGIILVGILFQSLIIGEISVVGYAVFAIVRRIPSRVTFSLAAISIITILIVLRLRSYSPLVDNLAIYAFILLAAGVASLIRETHAQSKVEE